MKIARLNLCSESGFNKIGLSYLGKINWWLNYVKKNHYIFIYYNFLESAKSKLIEKLREYVYARPIKYNFKLESCYNLSNAIIYVTNNKKLNFTYIAKFLRLVQSQMTSYTGKLFACKICFTSFNEQKKKN